MNSAYLTFDNNTRVVTAKAIVVTLQKETENCKPQELPRVFYIGTGKAGTTTLKRGFPGENKNAYMLMLLSLLFKRLLTSKRS